MLKKIMSEKKVAIGVVGAIVLVVVLVGAVNLITKSQEAGPKVEQNQQGQVGQQRDRTTDMEAARRRIEDRRQERLRLRLRENGFMREGFDEWLNEVTAAYQEEDMEKMGQLLERMRQNRQKLRERRRAYMERRRDLRNRPEIKRIPPSEIKERQLDKVEVQPDQP